MSAELELAGRVARHVRRTQRAPWADVAELQSVAAVAIVEAGRTYRPQCGDRDGYLWSAATYAARRQLWQGRAAVHVSKHRLDLAGGAAPVELREFHATQSSAETEHTRRELVERVRALLVAELGARDAEHLAALLAGERTSAELADERGEPVAQTYRWRERLVARMRRHAELRALWCALEET